jgi:hypothetical protein
MMTYAKICRVNWAEAHDCWSLCYGEAELAVNLGVTRSAVSQMRRRGNCGLPEEDVLLRMGPVWFPATICPWLGKEIELRYLHARGVVRPSHSYTAVDDFISDLMEVVDELPSVAIAFGFNATRAWAMGTRPGDWMKSLSQRYSNDRDFDEVLTDAKDDLVALSLWPWRRRAIGDR